MTDQLTNCIMLSALATEEVIRIDKEGFHYKGEFIADAGEAHRLMVEFLNQTTPKPEPVAPTDEEICNLALEGDFLVDVGDGFSCMVQDEVEFARAVLARWGTPVLLAKETTSNEP